MAPDPETTPVAPAAVVRRGAAIRAGVAEAVLLIDKPKGWSSFDVIRRLRRVLGVRKIGHAGTLDPMATGLLICCVGRATKQVSGFMGLDKTYVGRVRLGQRTPSHDAETEVVEERPIHELTPDRIEAAMAGLTGIQDQVPPMYSAVKVDGERLYRKARRGEIVERPPRRVRIDVFRPTSLDGAVLSFECVCSKGTYVRGLARDLGEALGCGAHLTELRRTAIGDYSVDDAWTLDHLAEAVAAPPTDADHRSGTPNGAGSETASP